MRGADHLCIEDVAARRGREQADNPRHRRRHLVEETDHQPEDQEGRGEAQEEQHLHRARAEAVEAPHPLDQSARGHGQRHQHAVTCAQPRRLVGDERAQLLRVEGDERASRHGDHRTLPWQGERDRVPGRAWDDHGADLSEPRRQRLLGGRGAQARRLGGARRPHRQRGGHPLRVARDADQQEPGPDERDGHTVALQVGGGRHHPEVVLIPQHERHGQDRRREPFEREEEGADQDRGPDRVEPGVTVEAVRAQHDGRILRTGPLRARSRRRGRGRGRRDPVARGRSSVREGCRGTGGGSR